MMLYCLTVFSMTKSYWLLLYSIFLYKLIIINSMLHNHCCKLSPRFQLRETGRVTQTSMFRTNKKALIFMSFEQNEFKILILSFKNHLHIFLINFLWSVKKRACLRNFPEIRGTENPGSVLYSRRLLCFTANAG